MGTQTPGVIRFWSTIVQRKRRVCFDSKKYYGSETMRAHDIFVHIFKYYLIYFTR